MNRTRSFPKPTGLALVAAALGVAVHLVVFFSVRIGVESPASIDRAAASLGYLGEADPDSIALIDPLVFLVSEREEALPLAIEDFRELSISREISPFPPALALADNSRWSDWITPSSTELRPRAWLLEQAVQPLREFGRLPASAGPLPPGSMTVRVLDLSSGRTFSETVPIPPALLEKGSLSAFPNPPSFVLDRLSPWTRPAPLLVESSGDLETDRALASRLAEGLLGNALEEGYYRLTIYLSPLPDAET